MIILLYNSSDTCFKIELSYRTRMGQIEISVDLNEQECMVDIKNITEDDHGEWRALVASTGQVGQGVKTKFFDEFSQNVIVTGNSKIGYL